MFPFYRILTSKGKLGGLSARGNEVNFLISECLLYSGKLACIYSYCRTMLAISGLDSCPAGTSCNNMEGRDVQINMATRIANLDGVCTESTLTDVDLVHLEGIDDVTRPMLPYSNGIIERNESGTSLNSLNAMCASPVTNTSKPFSGPRFRLIHEGEIQVCRLNHTRTIVSKIMNSRYLRRWESHRIVLGKNEIHSTMVCICSHNVKWSTLFVSRLGRSLAPTPTPSSPRPLPPFPVKDCVILIQIYHIDMYSLTRYTVSDRECLHYQIIYPRGLKLIFHQ